jgi:hypothetical protein
MAKFLTLFEKNFTNFLFVIIFFLSVNFIVRGSLYAFKVESHSLHYAVTLIILGATYAFGKTKYIYFSTARKYQIIAGILTAAFLFWLLLRVK